MEIETIVSDLLKSNMYVIKENDRCILIDPCVTNQNFENVDYILLTHEHYDHISGVNYWRRKTGAIAVVSKVCAEKCADPRKNMSRYYETFCELQTWMPNYKSPSVEDYICTCDEVFEGDMEMKWEGHVILIKECPGHSLGSCLIFVDDEILFSGDSIFENLPTECGFPGGTRKGWKEKGLPLIESLDKNYVVYPGHFGRFEFYSRYKGTKEVK